MRRAPVHDVAREQGAGDEEDRHPVDDARQRRRIDMRGGANFTDMNAKAGHEPSPTRKRDTNHR
jgi:hypothetical protein